jgi:hypothetical protein
MPTAQCENCHKWSEDYKYVRIVYMGLVIICKACDEKHEAKKQQEGKR